MDYCTASHHSGFFFVWLVSFYYMFGLLEDDYQRSMLFPHETDVTRCCLPVLPVQP